MTLPQDQRSAHQQQRFIELYNQGGFEIPAHGCCEVIESSRPESLSAETPGGGITVLHVRRPTQDGLSNLVINGPIPIGVGKSAAVGTNDYPAYVRWGGSGTPVPGQIWGSVAGQFYLGRGRQGFAIAGDVDADTQLCRVFRQERLHRLEIDSAYPLLPGADQLARVLAYNYAINDWEHTGTRMVTLRDPLCRAFALPGERIWAEAYGEANEDNQFQTVGEFGLHRRVRILTEVVNPGDLATVEVISGNYQEFCTTTGVYVMEVCYRGSQVLFGGQEGEAFYHPELKRWHLMVSGNSSRLIRFKMTSLLPLGGKGTAVEVTTEPAYAEVGANFPIKDGTIDPGRFRDDYIGYIGYCYTPDNPEYNIAGDPYREIIDMEQIARSIAFTTSYDAAPVKLAGGAIIPPTASRFGPHSVLCTVDDYYIGKDPTDVFGDEFAIFDPQGQFPRSLAGAKGKARYNDREHRYEMVVCDQQADKIQMYFDELCGSIMTATDDTKLAAWSHPPYGQRPAPQPEADTWLSNRFSLGLCTPAEVFLVWSEADEKYVIIQVPHVIESVAVGVRMNTDDCSLELKRKNIIAMACNTDVEWGCEGTVNGCGAGPLSDWCVQFAETTMVTGLSLSDGTPEGACAISATSRTVCAFDTGGGSSSSTVMTFTSQQVLTDLYASGTSLYGSLAVIYTPCSDTAADVELVLGYCCDPPCCCHELEPLDLDMTLTAAASGGVLSGSISMAVTSGEGCAVFQGSGTLTGCSGEFQNSTITLSCDGAGNWTVTISGDGANCAWGGTATVTSSDCGPPLVVVFTVPIVNASGTCPCFPATITFTITQD